MNKNNSMKKRIFEIIQIGNVSDAPSIIFDVFIVAAILINIFITFFETFKVAEPYAAAINGVELATIIIFIIEYGLRIWTANYLYPDKKPAAAIWKFGSSFYGIVDLLTIVSFFLPFAFSSGVSVFRMIRVVRILHLFRINSKYDTFNVITEVLKEKKNQLLASVFMIIILMLSSSLLIYGFEHDAQPENFENAFSGVWWAMSTMFTVGYGDIYPITIVGKMAAMLITLLGVMLVAIPTGIISAGFVEYSTKMRMGSENKDERLTEVRLYPGHEWIGQCIKDLDISRQTIVVLVIRDNKNIRPKGDTYFKENDTVVLFNRQFYNK